MADGGIPYGSAALTNFLLNKKTKVRKTERAEILMTKRNTK